LLRSARTKSAVSRSEIYLPELGGGGSGSVEEPGFADDAVDGLAGRIARHI
jgi:hypothetical protein